MGKVIQIPHKFLCRSYQESTWNACREGKKRIVCCWHRGAGKDLFALNWFIWKMLQKPAVYLHCFPNYSQAKRALWNSVHKTHDGETVGYLEHFPQEFIKYKNSQDMRIELTNGSIYQVMGLDGKNAQLARGMNPTDVIISEYAYMDSESWDVIEPRVKANDGQVLFLSTPNGKNHFYHLYNYAQEHSKEGYHASLISNDDTHIYDESFFTDLRNQGKSEDFIQQEYFCSFARGAQGSYYGKFIEKAREEERICVLNMTANLPVHTSWDIGISDSTAIFIFQVLKNGNINILDYYENHAEPLSHYLKYLDKWKDIHNAIWGMHFVPHDMGNRQMTTGNDLVFTAKELGYTMTIVPRKTLEEGIDCVRALLPHCSFHKDKTKFGINALEFYHKKWNENLKTYYDEPQHDQYSHGADSFRYLALGLKFFNVNNTNKITPEKINEMRIKNYGY